MTLTPPLSLDALNDADGSALAALLRICVPIDSWIEHLLDRRPYGSARELEEAASVQARRWTPAEVLAALSHHPRIGERASGLTEAESALSASEQAGVEDAGAWAGANRRYEARFDTVFLIRAAGRTQAEMLAALERRLTLTDTEEADERAEQLRQIALLRLTQLLRH